MNPLSKETKIKWEQTDRQSDAWDVLVNNKTVVELLFGGGGGGGKSFFMCAWAVVMCLRYVGIRGFIGRQSLEDFKKSTLLTLFDVLSKWGMEEDRDYWHNQQDKFFEFTKTKSRIYYNELSYYPSDPEYNYLGSTEYTFAGIDEANQVTKKGKNVIRTRLRYKITENGLTPKLLLTCNPDKGYLYTDFFKPYKNGTLSEEKAFIQALATDNNFNDATYIKNLEGIDDPATKERLLFGNWDYDNDPTRLMEDDATRDLFTNEIGVQSNIRYITADIARQGQDKTVLYLWEGFEVKEIEYYEKLPLLSPSDQPDVLSTEKVINNMRARFKVSTSHVLVDEDGMGGGVKDRLNCKGFVNGSSALKKENYANLKTQCYYKMAKAVNLRSIKINVIDSRIRDWLIEELEQVKSKNADKDGKLQILSKDEIKKRIGRSPDFSDAFAMRWFFELAPRPNIVLI